MAPFPWVVDRRRAVWTLLLALVLLVPALAESTGAAAKSPAKGTTKGVPAMAITDGELQEKIQGKLSKAKAGAGKFTVRVTGGVAYLAGRTEIPQHKGAATRMAKSAGAKRVVNNIVVSGASRDKVGAAAPDRAEERPRTALVR